MNNPIAYEPGVRIASAISARELKTTLKEGDSVVKTFSTLDEVVGFCIFIKGSELFQVDDFTASITVRRKGNKGV